MAKKVYLVDTENVGAVWKHLFNLATVTDDILLFYTENTPFLSYNDLEYILAYKEHFSMIKCYTGNNALDFQLVSYLGFLISKEKDAQYIIISNDTGYNSIIHFWNDRGKEVVRLSQAELVRLSSKQEEKDKTEQKEEHIIQKENGQIHKEDTENEVENLVAVSLVEDALDLQVKEKSEEEIFIQGVLSQGESDETICWLAEMLCRYNMKELAKIHSEIVKKFGVPKGSQIYREIKPVLKQFYQKFELNLNEKEKQLCDSLKVIESRQEMRWVLQMLSNYNMTHLQQIYQELLKEFGQEKGIMLYKQIKPMLKQFYAV